MRRMIVTALIALPLLTAPAGAAEQRMNSLQFDKAVECLAYANMRALAADRPDLSALETRVAVELDARPANARNEFEAEVRRIRMSAGASQSPAAIKRLSARRDRACRQFVSPA